jgi:hypothetical protein
MNRPKVILEYREKAKPEFANPLRGLINKILVSYYSNKSVFKLKPLRFLPEICCCLAALYGYWGAFTESGRVLYDEMAAMTPFFILVISLFILFILLSVRLYRFIFRRK